MVRGRINSNKTSLVEIIEFISGIEKDSPLGQDFRILSKLSEFMKSENLRRGRPASSLSLPPNWQRDGLHELDQSSRRLTHKFSKATCIIEEHVWKGLTGGTAPLYVFLNFSEVRAYIAAYEGCPNRQQCSALLAASVARMGSPGARSGESSNSLLALPPPLAAIPALTPAGVATPPVAAASEADMPPLRLQRDAPETRTAGAPKTSRGSRMTRSVAEGIVESGELRPCRSRMPSHIIVHHTSLEPKAVHICVPHSRPARARRAPPVRSMSARTQLMAVATQRRTS